MLFPPVQGARPQVSFAVDDVAPATKPLRVCWTYEAVRRLVEGPVESCCDYHTAVVADVYHQPLLAAVFLAYSEHRPLILTPDAVWLTIAQGVAHHMALHAERLRSRFVTHQGKLTLRVRADGWTPGSPENPWAQAFAAWGTQIREHVGAAAHDNLVCDFSTSGPAEQAASRIVMMDIFQRYFHYELGSICGIPTVTLEGSVNDWERLADKAAQLAPFDLDWWLPHLASICRQFVLASRGQADRGYWQEICKLREEYGGNIINGWIARLFPYVRAFPGGPCTKRNPVFETGEGFSTLYAPPGWSRVPFTWFDERTGKRRPMEAIGGLLGVTQDPHTLTLRPKAGWAVREAAPLDVLMERVAEHGTHPGTEVDQGLWLPPDLCRFYHETNGADLFRHGITPCRIVAQSEIASLDWGEEADDTYRFGSRGPDGRTWYRLASLADGGGLAINLDLNRRDPRPMDLYRDRGLFRPICRFRPETVGRPGQNPVVAFSFSELLTRMLDAGGPYWTAGDFTSYGDAEDFTRRGR